MCRPYCFSAPFPPAQNLFHTCKYPDKKHLPRPAGHARSIFLLFAATHLRNRIQLSSNCCLPVKAYWPVSLRSLAYQLLLTAWPYVSQSEKKKQCWMPMDRPKNSNYNRDPAATPGQSSRSLHKVLLTGQERQDGSERAWQYWSYSRCQ